MAARLTVLALALAATARAQPESLPERPPAPVVDQAGAIPDDVEHALVARILDVERRTSHQIAVAVVGSLHGLTVEDYAEQLFLRWGVGRKGQDDGALILLAVEDRKVRIEVGYGLEGALPDGKVGAILDHAMPSLRGSDWPGALSTIVNDVAAVLLEEPGAPQERRGPRLPSGLGFTLILIAVFFVIPALVGAARGRRCPRCKGRLSIVGRTLAGPTLFRRGTREVVATCPSCGHRQVWTEQIAAHGAVMGTHHGGWGGVGRGGGGGGWGGFGGGRSGGGGASRGF